MLNVELAPVRLIVVPDFTARLYVAGEITRPAVVPEVLIELLTFTVLELLFPSVSVWLVDQVIGKFTFTVSAASFTPPVSKAV
jgi:hypothetical protein